MLRHNNSPPKLKSPINQNKTSIKIYGDTRVNYNNKSIYFRGIIINLANVNNVNIFIQPSTQQSRNTPIQQSQNTPIQQSVNYHKKKYHLNKHYYVHCPCHNNHNNCNNRYHNYTTKNIKLYNFQ
jgi:hypothetical protein